MSDESLDEAMARAAVAIPVDQFDAQAVSTIANALAKQAGPPRDELLAHLCDAARALPPEAWSAQSVGARPLPLKRLERNVRSKARKCAFNGSDRSPSGWTGEE
jgi:hypothetical protein